LISHLAHPAGEASVSALVTALQICITFATVMTIAAQGIFVLNIAITLLRSAQARDTNPWRAASLEWVAAIPNRIAGEITVHRGAYEFLPAGITYRDGDSLPQNGPLIPSAELFPPTSPASNPRAPSPDPLGST